MSKQDLLAKLDKLSPEKREALLKKLQQNRATIQPTDSASTHSNIPKAKRLGNQDNLLFPQSFAQQRLWFLNKLDSSSYSYNLATALVLKGRLNIELIQQALNEIVHRHEILRTTFGEDTEHAFQHVHKEMFIPLKFSDIRHLSDLERNNALQQQTLSEAQSIFNLENGPLLKISVIQYEDQCYRLLVTMHHIIADGWSALKFTEELSTLYAAYSKGQPSPLPPIHIQYSDFSVWQRDWFSGDIFKKQRDFWVSHLKDAPCLELPIDKPRPLMQTFNGNYLSLDLDNYQVHQLQVLSQKNQTTLFVTLKAIFYTLLHRYSRQNDIVIGTPIANRIHPELVPLIGFFANTIALRITSDKGTTFNQLVQDIKRTSTEAQRYQDMPFDKVIEALTIKRDSSRSPLFQAFFSLDKGDMHTAIELPGITAHFEDADIQSAKFDISLLCKQHGEGLQCQFEYNTDLFEISTINQMRQHFYRIINEVIAQPHQCLIDIAMIDSNEQKALITDHNQTRMDYPLNPLIHELIEACTLNHPNAIAVEDHHDRLTYAELDQSANQLAHYLHLQGIQPNTLIGVCLERSTQMMISLLAVLKSGCAYVPIDPEYPMERIEYVIGSANINALICQDKVLSCLPSHGINRLIIDKETHVIAQMLTTKPDIKTNNNQHSLAYAIYTSGSTGKPKGVAVPHKAFVNFLLAMQQALNLSAKDRLLAVTTLSFDIAGLELFLPLISGARVVIASRDDARDGKTLDNLINQRAISILQATPSTWRLLLDNDWQAPTLDTQTFKALCGGETLPPTMANDLLKAEVDLFNVYGPTETTIWSTINPITDPITGSSVPIGRPIGNTSVFILDEAMKPVPKGVAGELWIGGDGLADGYIGRHDLTEQVFVKNPLYALDPNKSKRLYRTGDLARYTQDDELICLGRIDHQIKLRGHRIELGDIETVLTQHPLIKESVVIDINLNDNNKQLAAYIVCFNNQQPSQSDIQQHIRQSLPDYMVPSIIVYLDAMPLTPNGKVNRLSLLSLEIDSKPNDDYVPPRNPTEQKITHIWEAVLNNQPISVNSNFFDIGGHSLIATRILAQINTEFELDLPVRTLFELPTIESLAGTINSIQSNAVTTSEAEAFDEFEEGVL